MENGTIKFFDSRNNKRYGFIAVDGGGEIFFHYNDGQNFDGQNFGVTHGDQVVKFVGGRLGAEPKKGDRVMFDIVPGSKGRQKASPWGFADAYTNARKRATVRTKVVKVHEKTTIGHALRRAASDPVYRVLWHELDENLMIKHIALHVFWEGTFAELCQKFPQARDPNKDPLFIASKGYMVGFKYEVPTPNGWEMCNDPRPVTEKQ